MICRSLEGGEGFCDFDLDLEEAEWICTSKKILEFENFLISIFILLVLRFSFPFFDLG